MANQKKTKKVGKPNRTENQPNIDTQSKLNGTKLREILKHQNPTFGKCLNAKQAELKRAIKEYNIVIATGPAGTGKTFNALQTAFSIIMQTDPSTPSKILLAKSVTTVKGEDIGFLPGDVEDKLSETMISFDANIDKIFNKEGFSVKLRENGIIKYCPLAYIRGVQHDNSIVIVDETQNVTMETFKTIITRLGKGSTIIFLGDVEQIDISNKNNSCLHIIKDLFKNEDYIKIIEFDETDCVRNPLIPMILNKLKENNY